MTDGINGISNIGKISAQDSAKTDGKNDTAEETNIWDDNLPKASDLPGVIDEDLPTFDHGTIIASDGNVPTFDPGPLASSETDETDDTQTDQNDESKAEGDIKDTTVAENISKMVAIGPKLSTTITNKAAEAGLKIGQKIRNIITGGDEAKAEGTEENTDE